MFLRCCNLCSGFHTNTYFPVQSGGGAGQHKSRPKTALVELTVRVHGIHNPAFMQGECLGVILEVCSETLVFLVFFFFRLSENLFHFSSPKLWRIAEIQTNKSQSSPSTMKSRPTWPNFEAEEIDKAREKRVFYQECFVCIFSLFCGDTSG